MVGTNGRAHDSTIALEMVSVTVFRLIPCYTIWLETDSTIFATLPTNSSMPDRSTVRGIRGIRATGWTIRLKGPEIKGRSVRRTGIALAGPHNIVGPAICHIEVQSSIARALTPRE